MKPKLDPRHVAIYRRDGRLFAVGLIAAVAGGAGLGLGAWLAPQRTLYAYLSIYCGITSLVIGALLLLMIFHAVGARWPIPMRRLLEAALASMPLLALGFVPIAVLAHDLYPWVQPWSEDLPHHVVELLDKKKRYLDVGFFRGRAALYWVSWLLVGGLLLRWSALQDRLADLRLRARQRKLSAATLPWVGLTLTFAAFDWIMSLEPAWYSTIFGIDVFAGGFLAAIAVWTVAVARSDARGLLPELVSPSHYYALGRMLLAFVIFWAYIAFFQLLLIWIGNKPEEVAWYLHRVEGGWGVVSWVLVLGHFLLPFLVLLSYRIKRYRGGLAVISLWLVVLHFVDVHWKVVPALPGAAVIHWVDLAALLSLGGASLTFAMWRLDGRPIAPRLDPLLAKGAAYHRV